ncbi:MAG: ATP:cob(I)alamin adenosyltransferase, partial [Rhizobacter sp.]|nr:ATP:cob(I)alamin adenosyltransferase [Rhizobacter sp.]
TRITTRTGDDGSTGLGDGSRVAKDHLRVHAMGDVDELNSHIGVLLAETMADDIRALLGEIQHALFDLGGELSIPGFELLKDDALATLDQAIEHYNAALPRLAEFILPAGTRAASLAHVCRTVARRAERSVVSLSASDRPSTPASTSPADEVSTVPTPAISAASSSLRSAPRHYLNRLSDLMFVLARVLNRDPAAGGTPDDVYWRSDRLAQGEA